MPTTRLFIPRRTLIAGAGSLLVAPGIVRAQAQTSGLALVIGNSKYQWEAPLPNVKRDAPDVAKRFQAMGLKTELVLDAGRDTMRRAVDTFTISARGANFAALYFAGHGVTWGKDTYLVPVDADLANPNAVPQLVAVLALQTGMEAAANRLLVFDNCRNNPADGWRQRAAVEEGGTRYAPPPPAPNSLILYSTAPGRVALDGPAGENSPFAAALLRQLDGPSTDLSALPGTLRRALLLATQGRQLVFDQNTFAQPFLLKGLAGKATAADRSGWAGDPSQLVEFTNAYAYARQQGLNLPAGLVAHRAPSGSRHARKIGGFSFLTTQPGGTTVPALLAVLSVEEQDGVECVMATRISGIAAWAFRRVGFTGDELQMRFHDQGPRFEFKWSDANSGTVTIYAPERGGAALRPYSGRFTRLDG